MVEGLPRPREAARFALRHLKSGERVSPMLTNLQVYAEIAVHIGSRRV